MSNPALLIEGFLSQTREYAVVCLDPGGVITAWLGAAEGIFGYAEDEIVGKPASKLFTPEDHAKRLDKHELATATRNSRAEDDRWHVRKDGTRIWISGTVQAIRDSRNVLVGFVKLMRDRTDLRAHISHLENEVAEKTAAIERTHAFLRKLGHEMRNPLAPVQNAAMIIGKTHDDERTAKAVQAILGQVKVLQRMADDLMEVARLDAHQVELQLEVADMRDVLREACIGFSPVAARKGLDLATVQPEGRLLVRIDKPRMHQAIANLISNAIKYTAERGHIWIKPTQEGNDVIVRIEDTGMGISADMLPRLFDLFSRGKGAQELAPSGMGIGLAVVREIVELHGGDVQARSAGAGKGAEFTIRLPAADKEPSRG